MSPNICMNLESFFLFLERAELQTMIEKINDFTFVVHATAGDVLWILSSTQACIGGLGI